MVITSTSSLRQDLVILDERSYLGDAFAPECIAVDLRSAAIPKSPLDFGVYMIALTLCWCLAAALFLDPIPFRKSSILTGA